MNVTEIQKRLDKLVSAMGAKGMSQPSANVIIKSHQQPALSLDWKSQSEAKLGSDGAYEYFRGDSLRDLFDRADQWVAERPSPEEAKLREFMSAVGKAADMGRELGIEADFVNPLTVLMKTLSENALTYQPQPAE